MEKRFLRKKLKHTNFDGIIHYGKNGEQEIDLVVLLKDYKKQLLINSVGVTLPKNEKLWSMANIIADRMQVALSKYLILDKQQFKDLQEEWFDWLEDEINGN